MPATSQSTAAKQVQDRKESRPTQTAHGRRFTPEQRQHALLLVASGVDKVEVARVIGTTTKSVREWQRRALAEGTMPEVPTAPSCEVKPSSEQPLAEPAASTSKTQGAIPAEPTVPGGDANPSSELPAVEPVVIASENLSTKPVTDSKEGSPYAPKDPGQGLSDVEVAAILELKQGHPSYGPAQLRAQLKRFKGWRISNKAIARVLKQHGYELVHRGSRPQGPEPVRFEAPHRNALWQMDYAEMRVAGDRFHVLVILDDFSRFVVGHCLTDSPSGDAAIELLRCAIARHGKPEAVRTDRGGGFLGGDFKQALEAELIDHIVGRSYHPQGGGKVESMIGTLRRELWDVEHFADRTQAGHRVNDFITHYNERRAHMGIDGLTPADRFFGRADRVLAKLDEISRKRNGALDQHTPAGAAFEEMLGVRSGSPMEVLRFVIVDGHMELRLCGARVRLGEVEL